MLATAFKEWAVVCSAITDGQQMLLLRKGGIAEVGGEFRPEHHRFWLYPTYFHERQQNAIRPEALTLLETAESQRPPEGIIRVDTFVDVSRVAYITDLGTLLKLEEFHIGTEEMLRTRFHYRKPGIYVHLVRAYKLAEPALIPEHPSYAGCKTWVELETPIDTSTASPVVGDDEFERVQVRFEKLLHVKNSSTQSSNQGRILAREHGA